MPQNQLFQTGVPRPLRCGLDGEPPCYNTDDRHVSRGPLLRDVPTKTLIDVGYTPDEVGSFKLFKGRGCGICNGTGYKGRVGLYEVMEISEGIRDLIMVGATAVEIKKKALDEGMLTLRMSGLEKIKLGTTSIEEVLRETVL